MGRPAGQPGRRSTARTTWRRARRSGATCDACSAIAGSVLRGTAESLELRVVAAAPADDPDGLAIARRLADYLGRTVAVSRPFGEPAARPAAEAAARATLEAADAAARPAAGRARRPACRRTCCSAACATCPTARARPASCSRRSSSAGRRRQEERLETLRAVLGSASLGEAATRLGVHRNTIAYRVRRLEELTGWDLADPDLRFALELAARIVQAAQS